LSIWMMWVVTRPLVFGLTAYQALRLKLILGKPLMDSAVGDELLDAFARSNPKTVRMSNLQADLGLLQLKHIDAFNEGARQNARVLTENLGNVPGVKPPRTLREDHVYVYYPLTVAPDKRDDLRRFLLRHGVDTKQTDMSDCTALDCFHDGIDPRPENHAPREATILEICVYPIISKTQMKRIGRLIRKWSDMPETLD
jgi:dTDP-4-amino-4,6-dideoxygalactose transaminase